jgi:thymidylate synthase (FAD)
MADDLSVVNSARVSFGKQKSYLDDGDVKLIEFLMRERHGTPFEHNAFRFHVRCPIFVAREWFRHRIGSFNEFSARYTEVEPGAWVPEVLSVRTQVGKPGSYVFEPLPYDIQKEAADTIYEANDHSYRTYKYLLSIGVAKEIARTVLPMGTFTEFYWTVNARSLMNFLSLRTDKNAQAEIRQYANDVELHFANKMPHTYEAWVAHGRVAP